MTPDRDNLVARFVNQRQRPDFFSVEDHPPNTMLEKETLCCSSYLDDKAIPFSFSELTSHH